MSLSVLLICLVGALLELDTTYAFQFGISRGIIVAPILSLFTGDYLAGIQIGIFTDFLFADSLPLGGALPPSSAIASCIAVAMLAMGFPIYLAFFIGVLGAFGCVFLEKKARQNHVSWVAKQEQRIVSSPKRRRVNSLVVRALGMTFALNLIYLLLIVGVVSVTKSFWMKNIPLSMHESIKMAYMIVPWIGFATIISNFSIKGRNK